MEDRKMKKTYFPPKIETEVITGLTLLQKVSGGGVTGIMDDSMEIGFGGVDEDGDLDPSSNGFGGWDDGTWDKL